MYLNNSRPFYLVAFIQKGKGAYPEVSLARHRRMKDSKGAKEDATAPVSSDKGYNMTIQCLCHSLTK
jgi:hypothetical protein